MMATGEPAGSFVEPTTSRPTRTSAGTRAQSASTSAAAASLSSPPASYMATQNLDQVTANAVALGEGLGRLSAQELLDDLTLELDRMRAVLSHGLYSSKARFS